MVSLEKNQTWSLVRLPAGKKALQSKWVFRVKEDQDDKNRYKARLVVKGFQKKKRVNYNEIFSSVVKMTTIKLVLSIVAIEKLHLEQLDVKTSFLDGDLNEDIYMTQPRVFSQLGKKKTSMLQYGRDQEAQKTVVSRIQDEGFRKEVVLEGFSDSDYESCLDSGKSTTEVEYMAIAKGGKELVRLKNFFVELDIAQTERVLFCDNQSAIRLMKNLVFHGRTKHIKIRYHYIQELVSEGMLSFKKILGAKNPTNMLTKVVITEKLKLCATLIGLRDN
nr:retrovirus-related Pol polyprotein from transposon TNT 1-94 [Tanacetum cinerariifolium]